jgi:hypothetical protein
MRGWQGQPRKMVEYKHRRKKQRKGRSSGCGLQVGGAENDLLAIRLQSSITLFSVARPSTSRCLVLSALYLVQRCDRELPDGTHRLDAYSFNFNNCGKDLDK